MGLAQHPIVRHLGLQEYGPILEAMRAYTLARGPESPDEYWLLEHPRIFTLGMAADRSHVLFAGDIPVVRTDRGGQVTHHAPGQVVLYPLVDLRRARLFVKEFVRALESAMIATLAHWNVSARRVQGAPGIYVDLPGGSGPWKGLAKIGAVGLKVTRGCCYHGISLNVAMDLSGFSRIDPCGYSGLRTVDMATMGASADTDSVGRRLTEELDAILMQDKDKTR